MNSSTRLLAFVTFASLASCAHAPPSAQQPGVPARFRVEQRILGVNADGEARWLLIARFYDANGNVVRMLSHTDIDWTSTDAGVQWQTRMRFGQPSAIVRTKRNGIVHARVHVRVPSLGAVSLSTDTRRWSTPRVVATALGPYAVALGWFPSASKVQIERTDDRKHTVRFIASGSSFRDLSVKPNRRYTYTVIASAERSSLLVSTPGLPRSSASLDAIRGVGIWLSFSNNPIDADYAGAWNPQAIVDRAVRAHLQYVELRTAYGAFFEITPDVASNVDAVIDGLASHRIATIAWSVPRDAGIDDVQATIQSAYYRSAHGTPMRGLAVDLERGADFMGDAPVPNPALWHYVKTLREALGPAYPIVATVEDPYFEHLDNASYPYADIATYASALQPMSYWRMMRRKAPSPKDVRTDLVAAGKRLSEVSGTSLPLSIGGQTSAEGPNGHPPAADIAASIAGARAAGAIGICYFDFAGTTPEQWAELEKLKY